MKVGLVILLFFFSFQVAHSQSRNRQSASSAPTSLVVTATVESSVWLVMERDKSALVVANAPDPKESFSHTPAKAHRKASALAARKATARPQAEERNLGNDAVRFTFPMSKGFDVSKQTVMMDVSEGGKTSRQPVIVTTVVPE